MNKVHETSTFDKYASAYDTAMFQHDYFIKLKSKFILNYFKKTALSNFKLADFGCGTGEMISILAPFVKYCFGIDSSEKMILHAINKVIPKTKFIQRDCQNSGLKTNSIDLVTCVSLLHHVDGFINKVQILKELNRVVKPEGVIFIFEHNPWNPITRFIFQREPIDFDARIVSTTYMKKLCKNAGYNRYQTQFLAFFPESFKFLAKFEPILGWLPFGGQYALIALPNKEKHLREWKL